MIDAQQIISKYQLHSHPEGGYFRETYLSLIFKKLRYD